MNTKEVKKALEEYLGAKFLIEFDKIIGKVHDNIIVEGLNWKKGIQALKDRFVGEHSNIKIAALLYLSSLEENRIPTAEHKKINDKPLTYKGFLYNRAWKLTIDNDIKKWNFTIWKDPFREHPDEKVIKNTFEGVIGEKEAKHIIGQCFRLVLNCGEVF